MSYLTEKEEDVIDKTNKITINRGNKKFNIEKGDILGYGKLDLSKDSVDSQILRNQTWLLDLMPGKLVPVFNYNKSLIKRRGSYIQRTETWNVEYLCKYGHCCLDKPERVIIFKMTIKPKK